jgi:hypothetical protein
MTSVNLPPVPDRGPTDFEIDVLTTACEGGIGHWCYAAGEVVRREDLGILEITDLQDTEGDDDWRVASLKANQITAGIHRALAFRNSKGRAPSWHDELARAWRDQDAGMIDVGIADVIVQMIVFNEIVYG